MEDTKKQLEKKTNEFAKKCSRAFIDNTTSAALTISSIKKNQADLNTLIDELDSIAYKVINDGDTRKIEGMLLTQSKVLGILFNDLAAKASDAEYIDSMKAYMDLALRAQSQSVKAVLALHAIQHPPQQQPIVKQQNIAVNQQVNNGILQSNHKIEPKNELLELEVTNGKRLEFGTSATPIKAHPQMATLEVSGSEDTKGKNAK